MKRVQLILIVVLLANVQCLAADSSGVFNVKDFGANPDGTTSATKELQKAIDACAAAGGGTVVVPAGSYVTGTLWMKSNVTLDVQAGATLLGSQDVEEFPMFQNKWEGEKATPRRAALISGEGVENVSLIGRGTIDARGQMWWKLQKESKKEVLRPLMFRLINSKNILVEGLTFKNSPMWTISPLACENVVISRITIANPTDSPNTDGINPESCRNVRISNCTVDVGDDCITLKSGKETDNRKELWPTENITITNCTLMHGHGGVVIGSEMSGSVRNVTVSNCVFVGTDRGLRFKSRRGRGGVVEDFRADNLIMDGVLCPIAVNLFYAPGAGDDEKFRSTTSQPVDETTPHFRRLRFSNITARNVKYAAMFIIGLPEVHVEDVVLNSCSFYIDPKSEKAGKPEMAPGLQPLVRAGIVAYRVDKLVIRGVDVSDQKGPAVSIHEAKDLVLSDLSLRTSQERMIELSDVDGATVQGVSVEEGTGTALHISGKGTSDVRVGENDFSDAKKAVEVDPSTPADAVVSARDANIVGK